MQNKQKGAVHFSGQPLVGREGFEPSKATDYKSRALPTELRWRAQRTALYTKDNDLVKAFKDINNSRKIAESKC